MYDLIEGLQRRPLFPGRSGKAEGPAWAIRNHLKVLLNSRREVLPHLPEYGLPDLSVVYKNFPDSLEMIRQAIGSTIKRFEPRLTDISVRLVEKEDKVFHATYLVSAAFEDNQGKYTNIKFRTKIDSDGQMEVL
jgi:type VI secretion system lysozyme-like protein